MRNTGRAWNDWLHPSRNNCYKGYSPDQRPWRRRPREINRQGIRDSVASVCDRGYISLSHEHLDAKGSCSHRVLVLEGLTAAPAALESWSLLAIWTTPWLLFAHSSADRGLRLTNECQTKDRKDQSRQTDYSCSHREGGRNRPTQAYGRKIKWGHSILAKVRNLSLL